MHFTLTLLILMTAGIAGAGCGWNGGLTGISSSGVAEEAGDAESEGIVSGTAQGLVLSGTVQMPVSSLSLSDQAAGLRVKGASQNTLVAAGLTVEVRTSGNAWLASSQTDADGHYEISLESEQLSEIFFLRALWHRGETTVVQVRALFKSEVEEEQTDEGISYWDVTPDHTAEVLLAFAAECDPIRATGDCPNGADAVRLVQNLMEQVKSAVIEEDSLGDWLDQFRSCVYEAPDDARSCLLNDPEGEAFFRHAMTSLIFKTYQECAVEKGDCSRGEEEALKSRMREPRKPVVETREEQVALVPPSEQLEQEPVSLPEPQPSQEPETQPEAQPEQPVVQEESEIIESPQPPESPEAPESINPAGEEPVPPTPEPDPAPAEEALPEEEVTEPSDENEEDAPAEVNEVEDESKKENGVRCRDGIDNDADGAVDCNDDQCSVDSSCKEKSKDKKK